MARFQAANDSITSIRAFAAALFPMSLWAAIAEFSDGIFVMIAGQNHELVQDTSLIGPIGLEVKKGEIV